MKRCPKCNRNFPDENQKFCTFDGGLLIGAPAFDPNATIRATTAEVEQPGFESPREEVSTSRELPKLNDARSAGSELSDPNETLLASAPTAFFPRSTGPTGGRTSADLTSPQGTSMPLGAISAAPLLPQPQSGESRTEKRSILPWILASLVALLLLGGAGLAAVFFVAIKPRLEQLSQRRAETESPPTTTSEQADNNADTDTKSKEKEKTGSDTFIPPANTVHFTNSKENLDGKLAEHYVDFSFYYPGSWRADPSAGTAGASNFARVSKTVKEGSEEYTPESVALSWYTSNGTYDADVSIFPSRVEALSAQISKDLPNYRKVSEGRTQVNSLKAYDFHFTGVSKDQEQGDLPYWGRVIFIPPGTTGEKSGVTIIMLATARASDIRDEEDVGVKGEMPLILESFRLGKKD